MAGIDNTSRRQYDIEEFRAKAAKREIEESEIDGLSAHEVKQLKRRSAPRRARCMLRLPLLAAVRLSEIMRKARPPQVHARLAR